MPSTIERVVVDTPAGVKGAELQEFIQQADYIILPVLPSKGDIHAVAHFIETLLLDIKIKTYNVNVCVVANRVRKNTKILNTLNSFLTHIKFPFVTTFRETQNYIHAGQEGMGVSEMCPPSKFKKDIEQWQTLLDWLENDSAVEARNNSSSLFSILN
jgi:chromosome partitioning protein